MIQHITDKERALAAQVAKLTAERDDLARKKLSDQDAYVAMRAERDAWKEAAKYAEHIDATPENQLQTMLFDVLIERDSLKADADRYRWLRARPLDDDEIYIAVDSVNVMGRWGLGGDDPDLCDAAIDAARATS